MRASDQDRERTVAELGRHTGAGRLTLDEFAQRADAACAAVTLDELGRLTHDLPATSEHEATVPDPRARHELLAVFAVAVLTLLVLGAYLALSRG